MRTAVVVPFQANDGKAGVYLDRLRFSLAALSGQGALRILVDYASVEPSRPELERLAAENGFEVVRCDPPSGLMARHGRTWNRARALNAGIKAALDDQRCDLVAFVDADCVVAPGYIARHEEAVSSGGAWAATFSFVTDTKERVRPGSHAEIVAQGPEVLAGRRGAGFSHMVVPLGWFEVNGMMDERYVGWGAEDDDLWRRLTRAGFKRLEVRCGCGEIPSVFHLWHPPWASMVKGGEAMVARNRRLLQYSHAAKWGLLTIDPHGAVNLGNRLIEHSAREILGLGAPAVTVSMFQPIGAEDRARLNGCRFVMALGSTVLAKARGNSEAMDCIGRLKAPVFAFGASGWGPRHPPHVAAIKALAGPIGCRDPQILGVCRSLGAKARLVGCPTLLMPYVPRDEGGYWVAGFARRDLAGQSRAFEALRRGSGLSRVAVSVQEHRHEDAAAKALAGSDGWVFDYSSPAGVFGIYGGGVFAATGRLHGVLPAMSQRREVWFAGDADDTRFSLLAMLGIRIHPIGAEIGCSGFDRPRDYNPKLEELRQAVLDWKSETIDRTA